MVPEEYREDMYADCDDTAKYEHYRKRKMAIRRNLIESGWFPLDNEEEDDEDYFYFFG